MPQIKLATFNIGKGTTKYLPPDYRQAEVKANLSGIADLIETHSIDVIGLQEVDVKTNRNRGIDEPTFLRDTLRWPTRSSRFHPAIDFEGGEFGNATLVNLSRSDLNYKDSKIQRRNFKRRFGPEDRSALAIRLDLKMPESASRDYKNLWFVTTHFPILFSDWMPQLCEILSWTKNFSFPVVVCGDFNVPERITGELSTEYRLMDEMFQKFGYKDLGPFAPENFTFARAATRKLDYFYLRDERDWFTSGEQELVRPKLKDLWVSDHWLVTTMLSY